MHDRRVVLAGATAALAYMARREAPLGIVPATDARAEPKMRLVGPDQ